MTEAANHLDKNQELLDRIIHSFQIRMFWKDRDSRFIDCNQAFAEDAGFKSPDEVIGKTEFDMPWTLEEVNYHLQTDQAIIANGEPILSFEQGLSRAGN
ncbi:PAS domain S-box-containing protein [Polynucleobacter sphagniphilus]|uniref:PAS domain-containing protein n=1 Tax=Polynucleobacter sphagniphilus TaxID=1743169 RepID=UPI002475911F|nr:PAS domain-containing protein [Polynucleobacter sphagniphilus]MDH6303250.1 PAS domain S-box-containing protein [Polynucleobacter sphagniphilus]